MSDHEKLRITITCKQNLDAAGFAQSMQSLWILHEEFYKAYPIPHDGKNPRLFIERINEGSIVIVAIDFVQFTQQMSLEHTEKIQEALNFTRDLIDIYSKIKQGKDFYLSVKTTIEKNAPKFCTAIKNFVNPSRQEGNSMQIEKIGGDKNLTVSINSDDVKIIDQRMDKEIKNLTEHEGPPPRSSHESSGFSR